MENLKLIKSNNLDIHEVTTQQFLKSCISQNFIAGPNLILGSKPRIICININHHTRCPIYYYFPLHKNYFLYFNNVTKIVNRKRIENFLNFILKNDIYEYENNIVTNFNTINIKEYFKELLLDTSRIVTINFLDHQFIELLDVNMIEYIEHGFFHGNNDIYQKEHTIKVPLFFNIIERSQKINIVGIIDKTKVNSYQITLNDSYKFIRENTLEYFRDIVIKPIGEVFSYCPYIFPQSMLQYELLCQLYHIKPQMELKFFRYMFLLNTPNTTRKCLYPLNFDVFERIEINDLTSQEIELLSDYYMIPSQKLRNKHLHFMPIEEIGRSLLLLDDDVMLHRYTTDPPVIFDCFETYIYKEKD